MSIPKNIVLLLSGGLDSVVLLHDLHGQGHKVHPVLFHYEQIHEIELSFAKYHCALLKLTPSVQVISQLKGSSLTDGSGGVVVPFRNAVLLSHAANLAASFGVETVAYACNKDDEERFPDCRKPFIDAMNALSKASGYDVEICAPYLDKSKWWIAGLGREMGVDLTKTWSCYKRGPEPCGQCPACKKREAALK